MSSQSYAPVNNTLSLEPDVENPEVDKVLSLNDSIDVETGDIEKQPVVRAKQPVVRAKQQPTVTAKFMPIKLNKEDKIDKCCVNLSSIGKKCILVSAVILWFCICYLVFRDWNIDDDKYEGKQYLLRENFNKSGLRQLRMYGHSHFHKHVDPCPRHEFGCCELYTGNYVDGNLTSLHSDIFQGYNGGIVKKDKIGSNCPTLYQMIHQHNEQYMNKENCLQELNHSDKCCRIDVYADQMEWNDGVFKSNEHYKQHWNNIRYQYLIDYKDTGCPTAKDFIYERTTHYGCIDKYSKYKSCATEEFQTILVMIAIAFGILTLCFIKNMCNNSRRKY